MSDVALLKATPNDRVAAFLGCGVSASLAAQLASSPRFQTRMAGLISSRFGELGVLSPEQAKVLAMQPNELIGLSNRVGVVWHAGAIVRIIDGVSRRAFEALLGKESYELALACVDLQPAGASHDRTPDDIAKAVPIDGAACLAAWCESQGRAISARLRLTRPDASPERVHEISGPRIVAKLLADR